MSVCRSMKMTVSIYNEIEKPIAPTRLYLLESMVALLPAAEFPHTFVAKSATPAKRSRLCLCMGSNINVSHGNANQICGESFQTYSAGAKANAPHGSEPMDHCPVCCISLKCVSTTFLLTRQHSRYANGISSDSTSASSGMSSRGNSRWANPMLGKPTFLKEYAPFARRPARLLRPVDVHTARCVAARKQCCVHHWGAKTPITTTYWYLQRAPDLVCANIC